MTFQTRPPQGRDIAASLLLFYRCSCAGIALFRRCYHAVISRFSTAELRAKCPPFRGVDRHSSGRGACQEQRRVKKTVVALRSKAHFAPQHGIAMIAADELADQLRAAEHPGADA